MNKIASILTVGCGLLLLAWNWGLFSWSEPPPPPAPLPPVRLAVAPPPLERFVHDLVNEHRMAQGLTPLEFSREMATIAHVHSRNMATGYVAYGHGGMSARAKRVSNFMPYRGFGENVAAMNRGGEGGEAKAAVVGWLQSPGHRANIEGDFTLTGIGIAQARDGTYYFTQLFMAPAGPAPSQASSRLEVPPPSPVSAPAPSPDPSAARPAPEVDPPPSLLAQLVWAIWGLIWSLFSLAWDLLLGLAWDLFAPTPSAPQAPAIAVGPPAATPVAVPLPAPEPAHLTEAQPPPAEVDAPPHGGVLPLPGPRAAPPAALTVPQVWETRPAYSDTPPSRKPRPEKDPRGRPGRRRTGGGWVQKLE